MPNAEYLANIKSEYPKLIEIFKKAELPEIIAQHVPNGFTDEQIVRLLDHLFDITIKKGKGGKFLLTNFGGHANVGGLIKESEMLQFLDATTPKMINGFYDKRVIIKTPFGKFNSYKTYFPSDWTPEQIVEHIAKNLHRAEFSMNAYGKLEGFVPIHENLELQYIFNPELKLFDTVFPSFINATQIPAVC